MSGFVESGDLFRGYVCWVYQSCHFVIEIVGLNELMESVPPCILLEKSEVSMCAGGVVWAWVVGTLVILSVTFPLRVFANI